MGNKTEIDLADELDEYISQCSRKRFLEIYNYVFETNIKIEELQK